MNCNDPAVWIDHYCERYISFDNLPVSIFLKGSFRAMSDRILNLSLTNVALRIRGCGMARPPGRAPLRLPGRRRQPVAARPRPPQLPRRAGAGTRPEARPRHGARGASRAGWELADRRARRDLRQRARHLRRVARPGARRPQRSAGRGYGGRGACRGAAPVPAGWRVDVPQDLLAAVAPRRDRRGPARRAGVRIPDGRSRRPVVLRPLRRPGAASARARARAARRHPAGAARAAQRLGRLAGRQRARV